jgi:hypothetical protein
MPTASPLPEKGLPALAPDGVDLTLIRWTLSLTPAQRLQVLEQSIRSIEKLRARRIRD